MRTILFITDRTDKVNNYRKTFTELEWAVEVYNSIEVAAERIKAENAVDVIVCETVVKGSAIDGLSFARKMSDKYPIVLMSSKDEFVTEAKQNGFVAFKRTGQNCDNIFNRVARATDLFEKDQSHEKLKEDMRIVKHDFHCIKSGLCSVHERMDTMTSLLESNPCINRSTPKCAQKNSNDTNGEEALIKANSFLVSAKKSPILSAVFCIILASLAATGFINTTPKKITLKPVSLNISASK